MLIATTTTTTTTTITTTTTTNTNTHTNNHNSTYYYCYYDYYYTTTCARTWTLGNSAAPRRGPRRPTCPAWCTTRSTWPTTPRGPASPRSGQ